MDDDLRLVEKLQGFREDLPEADDIITDAIDTIIRLVKERDEALAEQHEHMAARGELFTRALKAEAENERLAFRARDEAQAAYAKSYELGTSWRTRAETAEAQRDAALEALKPLAECEIIESDTPLPDSDSARYFMTMGEIRAARAASRAGGGE